MDEIFRQALSSAEMGMILIDEEYRIALWNLYIERISSVKDPEVLGKNLFDVCPVLAQPQYREMFQSVFRLSQCRFCSSKIHKAFIYPLNQYDENVRQNMSLVPLVSGDKQYILIQIQDITYQITSEHKLASLLSEMKKGYSFVKESEEINRMLAESDPLTGLPNRIALMRRIGEAIESQPEFGTYAVMFLDLDSFKTVNDTLGHGMGDKLLIKIAEKLLVNVRSDDLVARLGGDEFVVLIRSKGGIESTHVVARKLLSAIAQPSVIEGQTVQTTCSIGVALLGDETTPEAILEKADKAMYASKRKGKNSYMIYAAADFRQEEGGDCVRNLSVGSR